MLHSCMQGACMTCIAFLVDICQHLVLQSRMFWPRLERLCHLEARSAIPAGWGAPYCMAAFSCHVYVLSSCHHAACSVSEVCHLSVQVPVLFIQCDGPEGITNIDPSPSSSSSSRNSSSRRSAGREPRNGTAGRSTQQDIPRNTISSGSNSSLESVDGVLVGDVSSGVTAAGRSYFNLSEVAAVLQLLKQVLEGGHLTPSDIGVITPYSGQVRLMLGLVRSTCFLCCCAVSFCSAGNPVAFCLLLSTVQSQHHGLNRGVLLCYCAAVLTV
jgi:hypothetical protein